MKFDIVKKIFESKYPGVTLVKMHFKNVGSYGVMYIRNNNILPISFRTLQDLVDHFDLVL